MHVNLNMGACLVKGHSVQLLGMGYDSFFSSRALMRLFNTGLHGDTRPPKRSATGFAHFECGLRGRALHLLSWVGRRL